MSALSSLILPHLSIALNLPPLLTVYRLHKPKVQIKKIDCDSCSIVVSRPRADLRNFMLTIYAFEVSRSCTFMQPPLHIQSLCSFLCTIFVSVLFRHRDRTCVIIMEHLHCSMASKRYKHRTQHGTNNKSKHFMHTSKRTEIKKKSHKA